MSTSFNDTWITIDQDRITANSFFRTLTLERYYKSDWHGIVSANMSPNLAYHLFTLDCRTEDGKIDEVLNKLN